MRIIDRLDKYMEANDINDNQITVNCALSVGLLGKARKGDSDLGKKAINKILSFYQDLNMVWLLTGEGDMIKSTEKPIPSFNPIETVPMSVLQYIMESGKTASAQMDELIRQNGVLVDTVSKQAETINKSIKKPLIDAHPEDNVKCANVSGSDLQE